MIPDDATRVLARLTAKWPHKELPKATLADWRDELCSNRFAYQPFVEAVRRLGERSKFMPSFAELVDEAREVAREHGDRAAGDDAVALPAQAPSLDPQRHAKCDAFRANLRSWSEGRITTREMIERATEIECEMRPIPSSSERDAAWAACDRAVRSLRDPDARATDNDWGVVAGVLADRQPARIAP